MRGNEHVLRWVCVSGLTGVRDALKQADKAEAEAKHAEAQQQLGDLQRAVEEKVCGSNPPPHPPSFAFEKSSSPCKTLRDYELRAGS